LLDSLLLPVIEAGMAELAAEMASQPPAIP
jgi:hypothetical protein